MRQPISVCHKFLPSWVSISTRRPRRRRRRISRQFKSQKNEWGKCEGNRKVFVELGCIPNSSIQLTQWNYNSQTYLFIIFAHRIIELRLCSIDSSTAIAAKNKIHARRGMWYVKLQCVSRYLHRLTSPVSSLLPLPTSQQERIPTLIGMVTRLPKTSAAGQEFN